MVSRMRKAPLAIGTLDFEHDICDQLVDLGYQFQIVLRDPANGGITFYTNVRSRGLSKLLTAKMLEGAAEATSHEFRPEDEQGMDENPAP